MTFICSIAIFTSMIFCIWSRINKKRSLEFLFKPLTIILIFLLPFINFSMSENFLFIHYIIFGLFFSIIGDYLLMLKQKYFIIGLINFMITHLFYLAATLSIRPFSFSWIVILFLFLWFLFNRSTLPSVSPSIKPAILIYSLVIGILFWQAGEILLIELTNQTIYFFIGITLFLISDWMLAENLFKSQNKFSFVMLPIYFTGQWFIAISAIIN